MEILEKVKEQIAGILNVPADKLDPNAEMTDVEGWDSMRNIMILQAMEESFDIMFPEDDIFDLTSVSAIAEEIEKLKG